MTLQEFLLPEIGEGVMEGEIVEWHINEGSPISVDQVAVSILTDKATMELSCPFSGTLQFIVKKAGETALVGSAIAHIETAPGEKEELQTETSNPTPQTSEIPFVLPEIGEGVIEGEIVEWMISEGDWVEKDQVLFSILTDKATMEITSPYRGKITQLMVAKGEPAAVGQKVLYIIAEGQKSPTVDTALNPVPTPVKPLKSLASETTPPKKASLASPAVRRKARALGINLETIQGSGENARITMKDLTRFSTRKTLDFPSPANVETPLPQLDKIEGKREPIKGLRKAIFNSMALSKKRVPHFTYVEEVEMDALISLRADLKEDAQNKGVSLSFLPFIITAVNKALVDFPMINVSVDEESREIVFHPHIHIGLATSTPRGLMVPVIKNSDQKSLFQLASEIKELSDKARALRTSLDEVSGGTFTITSLGKLGGLLATPIINYPEAGIMGIHQIKERAVVRNGVITIRNMMNLAGSFDHRIIDGNVGAAFIQEVKNYLEHPARLLIT